MSMDTSPDSLHVARSGYMFTVSQRHNYYSFMSRSTFISFYPAKTDYSDKLATVLSPKKKHVDGNKWIQLNCIRQHVSWCKRGIKETK